MRNLDVGSVSSILLDDDGNYVCTAWLPGYSQTSRDVFFCATQAAAMNVQPLVDDTPNVWLMRRGNDDDPQIMAVDETRTELISWANPSPNSSSGECVVQ